MNTLENKIQADLTYAMKNRQENSVAALRSIKTAIMETRTDDNDIVKIIQKLVKQRQESMDIYSQAGRHELADKEQQEMFVLKNYLPDTLSEEELKTRIDVILIELNPQGMKDMGKVMKTLGERYPNQYDGKVASSYIKERLQGA